MSKGTGAVMSISYLTALSSSLGGNIIKLFKFDYLQILSALDLDIQLIKYSSTFILNSDFIRLWES